METVSLVTEDLLAALQRGKERCEEAKTELERQHQLLQWLVGKYSFQELRFGSFCLSSTKEMVSLSLTLTLKATCQDQ